MKRWFVVILALLVAAPLISAQTVILSDDFEGGTGLWESGGWGLSTQWSFSPTHSFTESPGGLYPNNASLIANMRMGANLTGYLDARVEFWALYEIEPAFDRCWVEASRDGDFWVPLGSLSGLYPFWQYLSYDFGAFAGLPEVFIRFRFVSDPLTAYNGAHVDDFRILGYTVDESGPLILHNAPFAYAGAVGDYSLYADFWDASGIASEHLYCSLDGCPYSEVGVDSVVAERYYYTIPEQETGTLVCYYFEATDASTQMNSSVSDTFSYLAGRMLVQDDGVSEGILEPQPGDLAAVRFQATGADYLTSALLRIYTDSSHPLDSIAVYVWADFHSFPAALLGGPFKVFPASTPEDPEAWTWVDLRPALITAPDTFHIGCEFAITGSAPLMGLSFDSPAVYRRSTLNTGSGFQTVSFGDFHIRAVVGRLTPDSLLAPSNLTGQGEDNWVYLSWEAPSGWDNLLRYEIERQGIMVGQTAFLETTYTDTLTGLPQGEYSYRVRARYSTGASGFSDPWFYQYVPVSVGSEVSIKKQGAPSMRIFPNPTNGKLNLHWQGGEPEELITLFLYDLSGRKVGQWRLSVLPEGMQINLTFPPDLAAGVYLLKAVLPGSKEIVHTKVVYLP
ncbi:MAG: hypothetical protein ABH878_09945 [bacterium]